MALFPVANLPSSIRYPFTAVETNFGQGVAGGNDGR